jgi:hypothetical protein
MDQKPGLFSAPAPNQNGVPNQAPKPSGGFFGQAQTAAAVSPVGNASTQFSELSRRLRMVEESLANTRRKVEIAEENTLEDQKKKVSEIKSIFTELDVMKKEIRQFKDEMLKMVKEFQTLAKREDVAVLEKYIKLWEPIRYATVDQVDRMIEERVSARIAELQENVAHSPSHQMSLNRVDQSQNAAQSIRNQHYSSSLDKTNTYNNNNGFKNDENIISEDSAEYEETFQPHTHIPLKTALKSNIFEDVHESELKDVQQVASDTFTQRVNQHQFKPLSTQEKNASIFGDSDDLADLAVSSTESIQKDSGRNIELDKIQSAAHSSLTSMQKQNLGQTSQQSQVRQNQQPQVSQQIQNSESQTTTDRTQHNPWSNLKPNEKPKVNLDSVNSASRVPNSSGIGTRESVAKSAPSELQSPAISQYMERPAKYEVTAEQKKQIAALIEEFEDVRELLLNNPTAFEKKVFADSNLAKLFKGVDILELSAKLKPHYS